MGRHLRFAFLIAFGAIFAGTANAQQKLRIQLKNRNIEAVQVSVYDDVCDQLIFQRRLEKGGSMILSICVDRKGTGQISVYDVRGRRQTFKGLRQNKAVYVKVR